MFKIAAPAPKSPPRATAPVFIGAAALPLAEVAALEAALVMELAWELTERVRELRADEREAASDPVAVESWLERDEMAPPASEVRLDSWDEASEVMEEIADARDEVRELRSEAIEVATEVAEPRTPPVVAVGWAPVPVCWAWKGSGDVSIEGWLG